MKMITWTKTKIIINPIGDKNKKILLKKVRKVIQRKILSVSLKSLNKDLKIRILMRKSN